MMCDISTEKKVILLYFHLHFEIDLTKIKVSYTGLFIFLVFKYRKCIAMKALPSVRKQAVLYFCCGFFCLSSELLFYQTTCCTLLCYFYMSVYSDISAQFSSKIVEYIIILFTYWYNCISYSINQFTDIITVCRGFMLKLYTDTLS